MIRFLKYAIPALLILLAGVLIGYQLRSTGGGSSLTTPGDASRKLNQALSFIQERYVEQPDNDALVEAALNGMLESLDPHSVYIPPADASEIHERMEGSFDGIGVQFSIIEDTIYVEATIPGGPSEQLGIKAGDRIVKVDGKSVAGIQITNEEVMKRLKGPRGSNVLVAVKRSGVRDLIEFDIKRDKIPLHSLDYAYMIAPETGYIRISRFAETTYSEFMDAMSQLQSQGMRRLVLDLRGNPGGYLTMATRMADEFLAEGEKIVSTMGRAPESKETYTATAEGVFEQGKVIVLMDYGSASASEILAGAVQDHDRGLVVGVRSFGKGLVQIQEDFKDGSAMRLVVAKYDTPSGRCIQKPYKKSSAEYEHEIIERFESGEIYDPSKVSFPDSLKFKTANGRVVYGGGGIFPDVFVPSDTSYFTPYFTQLEAKDLFRLYATQYVDQHPGMDKRYKNGADFVKNFRMDAAMMQGFLDYAVAKGVKPNPSSYAISRPMIENRLKAFIGRRLFNEAGFYPTLHQIDPVVQKALELLPDMDALLQPKL